MITLAYIKFEYEYFFKSKLNTIIAKPNINKTNKTTISNTKTLFSKIY